MLYWGICRRNVSNMFTLPVQLAANYESTVKKCNDIIILYIFLAIIFAVNNYYILQRTISVSS